ncbi:MAG: YfcC family protein [Hungatella sp.]|nr:YfcC family protein [Hungatella sp.]
MEKKQRFETPHSLAIIFAVMVLASLLTYVIPAGCYDRITDSSGLTVVDPATFHYVDKTPVNPITILSMVFDGLSNARGIIFSLMCCGGGLGIVLSTGMFQGAAGTLGRKASGKEWMVIAFLMTVFSVLCIPINLNNFIPFAPLGLVIAASLGLDAIVGISIIMLGGAVGFSCGAMNISNTGTAQDIAQLPTFSGMGYRLFCMIPFLVITILYVVLYARKIKKDAAKSYVYGLDLGTDQMNLNDIPVFEKKHIPVAIVTAAGIGTMIYMALNGKSGNKTTATVFTYMGLAAGIAYRLKPNEICKRFMTGIKNMAPTSMMIGFAYVIAIILEKGNIMDTIVYHLAGTLNYLPNLLKAPAMLVIHTVVNLFITSGSGQAAATMPIMVPMADLVGMSRQTAVLAFNFGDGFCNFILPHAAATMGFVGVAGIPFGKWFQYAIKLFLLWFVIGCILLMLASVTGYS